MAGRREPPGCGGNVPRSELREHDAGLRAGAVLMAASSLTAVALAGISGLSLARMHAADQRLISTEANLVDGPRRMAAVRQRLQAGYAGQARYFATLATAPAAVDLAAQTMAMRELDAAIDTALAEMGRAAVGGKAAEQLDAVRSAIAEYRGLRDRLAFDTGTAESGPVPEDAEQLVAKLDSASARVEQLVAAFAAAEQSAADARFAGDRAAAGRAYTIAVWSVLLTMLVTVPVGFLLVRRVLAATGRLRSVFGQRACGDGTEASALPGRGGLVELASTVDGTAARMDRVGQCLAGWARQLSQRADWIMQAGAGAGAASGRAASGGAASGRAGGMQPSAGLALAVNEVQSRLRRTASTTAEIASAARSIVERVDRGERAAERATQVVHAAGETIARLGRSSAEIGAVLQLITSVAEQTNLLAVNATIEAAHAGAAGRGFAIVAGEVKELASQTAGATDEIRRRIAAIQGDTKLAVDAIDEVEQVVRLIDSQQVAITEAASRQAGVAGTISEGIRQAAESGTRLSVILRESAEANRAQRPGNALSAGTAAAATPPEVSQEYRQAAAELEQLAIDMREIASGWHHSGDTAVGQAG